MADEKNSEMEGLKLQKKELESEIAEYIKQSEAGENQIEEMQVLIVEIRNIYLEIFC